MKENKNIKIRIVIEKHQIIVTPEGLPPKEYLYPKSSCSHCYGRGVEGINKEKAQALVCRCLWRQLLKQPPQTKFAIEEVKQNDYIILNEGKAIGTV